MVSTQLKSISQPGNLPQVGVKIKNIWNVKPPPSITYKFLLSFPGLFFLITKNGHGKTGYRSTSCRSTFPPSYQTSGFVTLKGRCFEDLKNVAWRIPGESCTTCKKYGEMIETYITSKLNKLAIILMVYTTEWDILHHPGWQISKEL